MARTLVRYAEVSTHPNPNLGNTEDKWGMPSLREKKKQEVQSLD
jgi:hypothetical protein